MGEVVNDIKIESLPFPSTAGSKTQGGNKRFNGYRVRYLRVDMTDPTSIAELENVETKAIVGDNVVLLGKVNYMFMDKFFYIVNYLEKTTSPTVNSPTPGPDLSTIPNSFPV